jgi:unspecific monooxygenase
MRYGRGLGRPYVLDLLLPLAIPSPRDLPRALFRPGWMRLIDRLIAERRRLPTEEAPRDLLDLLAAARDPETGATFSATQLRDQVATMLVAGHETTAVTLFWSLYLLAAAPAEQEKVAAEVAGLELGPEAAAETLPKLVQTRAVVSEALRLYPPAFVMVREAIGADTVGGVPITPGTLVMITPWVLHRHRRLWRDPDAFDPSRFLPGAPPIDRFAYLPFGAGPRVCVGAQFALTEATLVLATLVQNFRLTVETTRPVLPVGVITTQPDHSPPFTLTPR